MRPTLLLTFAVGCTPTTITFGDTGVVDDADTDTDVDTDTDADTDTDTSSSTADISWVPTSPGGEGSTLGLYPLTAEFTVASDAPSVTADFDGTRWGVTWTPPDDALIDTGLSRYAVYVAAVTDGSGADIGLSEWLAFYVDGTPGDDMAPFGVVAGWNALKVVAQQDLPLVEAPVDLGLPFNLVTVDSVTVSGTWSGTVSAKYRLAVYPYTGTGDMLYDASLPESWRLTLTGRPVDSALADSNGVVIGGGTPFAYTDNDGSRTVSTGDGQAALGVLDSGEAVGLVWVDPVSDVEGAFLLVLGLGGHVGWGAYEAASGEKLRELDPAEEVQLDP